jgi:hypothetical protein
MSADLRLNSDSQPVDQLMGVVDDNNDVRLVAMATSNVHAISRELLLLGQWQSH